MRDQRQSRFESVNTMDFSKFDRYKLQNKILKDKEVQTQQFTCPNCGKVYTPVLKRRQPNIAIQKEFPHASAMEREQHISHLCSDKCWNEYLGQ